MQPGDVINVWMPVSAHKWGNKILTVIRAVEGNDGYTEVYTVEMSVVICQNEDVKMFTTV